MQDLKKYNFYFWFAFPASIEPIVHESASTQTITECFSEEEIENLTQNFHNVEDRKQLAFFTCNRNGDITFLRDVLSHESVDSNLSTSDLESMYFCFADPSQHDQPGWPLRNFILLLMKLCPAIRNQQIKVIAIREHGNRSLSKSKVFHVDLSQATGNLDKSEMKWTGWEKNQGKLVPKLAQMADSMDPIRLSSEFANLNLKLMKWRLLPNLNLDVIKEQKCLLFGSGTLGCAIARNLLSWGVTNFTFIDYGNVSFSNPVRQSLFTHDDAVKRRSKSKAAAERLKEILPSINSVGETLQIPMPGHSVPESMEQKTIESIEKIKDLIQSHDVLFLVTDSRESRWLPTLLGAFYGKVRNCTQTDKVLEITKFIYVIFSNFDQIVITTALGFDSYLVMRHGGGRVDKETQELREVRGLKCISGNQLGCYFCNDVTAPGNVSNSVDDDIGMTISFEAFTVRHSHVDMVDSLNFKMKTTRRAEFQSHQLVEERVAISIWKTKVFLAIDSNLERCFGYCNCHLEHLIDDEWKHETFLVLAPLVRLGHAVHHRHSVEKTCAQMKHLTCR